MYQKCMVLEKNPGKLKMQKQFEGKIIKNIRNLVILEK